MPVAGKHTDIPDQNDAAPTNPASRGPDKAEPAPKGPAPKGPETLPVVIPVLAIPPAAGPNPKRRWWPWAGAGLVAAGVAGLMYGQPWATPIPAVTVETVLAGPVTRVLAVNGRIAGVRSVDVRPLVSGTLIEVLVSEGDTVSRTQTLMRIDGAGQQAILRQALAGLDSALVAQQDTMATLARTRALGANVARVVQETAARADQSAAQEVARMTALLEQAQIQLETFTLRAPIAGTVLVLHADPGQSVDPATVLLTIADLGLLVVETDVDESYATQIRTGQPAALQLSGEEDVRAGQVSFVSQRVDAETGGLAVRLTAAEPLSAPIGLTVTANITVDDRAAAITVPRAAIIRDAGGDVVLVLADGQTQRRVVQVIDWPAARLIVTQGLTPGEVVIADPTGLSDGQAVSVAP